MAIDKLKFLSKMYSISDSEQVNTENFNKSIEALPVIDTCYNILRDISEKLDISIEMMPTDFKKMESDRIGFSFAVSPNDLLTENPTFFHPVVTSLEGYTYSIQPGGNGVYNIDFLKEEDKRFEAPLYQNEEAVA